VQLAKYFGADVTAVCSGPNRELVESLGADRSIDYTKQDFSEQREAYDVVFDTVGLAPYAACMRALKKDGAYLQAVAEPGLALRMAWTALTSQRRVVGGGPEANSEDLHRLAELAMEGKIVPTIDQTFLLEQIAEAHSHVDTGHKRGNVVIRPLRVLVHEAEAA
jgi:NADPH:quinone reductase-like Zn-dependent oxidoreductase